MYACTIICLFNFKIYVCVCVYAMYVWCLQRPEEGARHPRAEVIGRCEPQIAGEKTLGCLMSSTFSWPQAFPPVHHLYTNK